MSSGVMKSQTRLGTEIIKEVSLGNWLLTFASQPFDSKDV